MRPHLATLLILLAPAAVRAQPKQPDKVLDACIRDNESGQRMFQENQLRGARDTFARCSVDACPAVLRNDCKTRGESAAAAIPSARFELADGSGRVLPFATVSVDGGPSETLSTTPMELDPGHHVARLTASDGRSVEVPFDLAVAQKHITVRGVVASRPDEPVPREQRSSAEGAAPIPVASFVFGGVALAGVAGFAAFGSMGRSAQSDLDACKPHCTNHGRYDAMKRDYLIANISLGVGVVAAGLATVFYLTSREDRGETPPSAPVDASVLPGGAVVHFRRAF